MSLNDTMRILHEVEQLFRNDNFIVQFNTGSHISVFLVS